MRDLLDLIDKMMVYVRLLVIAVVMMVVEAAEAIAVKMTPVVVASVVDHDDGSICAASVVRLKRWSIVLPNNIIIKHSVIIFSLAQ
jgi:hypothetical protein